MNIYYGYRSRVNNPKWSMAVVTPTSEEPITLAQACDQVRQEVGNDDTYINALIPLARQYVENMSGQFLCLRTLSFMWDEFPFPSGEMVLPLGPLNSITSITYRDLANTLQTFDPSLYQVDTNSILGAAYLPLFNYWPMQICQSHSVKITGVFGFGSVASGLIPAPLIHAVKMALSHFYEERAPISMGLQPFKVPDTLEALVAQYRTNWV